MRAFPLCPAAASLAVVLVLAGCNVASHDDNPGAAGSVTAMSTSPMDPPDEDVPPATAPPGTVMAGKSTAAAEGLARWDGFGDVQLGMDRDQVQLVWPGELAREGSDDSSCYYLIPVGETGIFAFAMMFEDGSLVRYDVDTPAIIAPGGGAVGMDIARIKALYPGRIETSGHEYLPGGHYLRIEQEGGEHVLVFEIDPGGTVTEWRVGLSPPVDYVEGCS